jgi:hypothetical protein
VEDDESGEGARGGTLEELALGHDGDVLREAPGPVRVVATSMEGPGGEVRLRTVAWRLS